MKLYEMRDIRYLLKLFLEDGFTLECLSRATNTPVEVLQECLNQPICEYDFDQRLVCPFVFLQILYEWFPYEEMLVDNVGSLCRTYGVPKKALANYMGMTEVQFDTFIENYREYPNGRELALKLEFVISLFTKDKSAYM